MDTVQVDAPARWRAQARVVQRVAERVLPMGFPPGTGVGIRLVDDAEMLALQRAYRHKRGLTDVLSFEADLPGYAGDVAICMSVARAQAHALGHALETELTVLTVHALMHLWGLDHERGADEAMRQAEMEMGVLDVLGVPVEAALARRGF